ncbi:MAG: IS1634 family transposase [Candidatus Undinarchaeales archaeon]|jgi:transposase|nr:IS1634 family transposase [Candidatus Undinarchaeales archaeon]MDP7494605.1 IS1634 family transposase [Candidatus Undinarchaeales archaeon]
MVQLVKKTFGKYSYYYLVEKKKVDGKVKTLWQIYLGTPEKIAEFYRAHKDLPEVKLKSFPFGLDAALLAVSDDLGFVDVVDTHTSKKKIKGLTVGEYALLVLMGRCSAPVSKEGVERWFNKDTFLHLLWSFPHQLSGQNVRNHLDYLLTPEEESRGDPGAIRNIEEDLARALLVQGVKPTTLIWDTTNVFTHIEKGGKLLKKTKSKQMRFDKNHVAFGLAVSQENIPFLSEVYEANEPDVTLFPKVFGRLVDRLVRLNIDTEGLTLVFDKGNNSVDNLKAVLGHMHVVGALRRDHPVAAELLAIDAKEYEPLYTTGKGHAVTGLRRDDVGLFGMDRPFTVVAKHNDGTRRKQEGTYDRTTARIIETLEELKAKAGRVGGRGRRMTEEGLHRAINDAIYKDYRALFHYTVRKKEVEIPGKNRRSTILDLEYWLDEEKERERPEGFGKSVLFTDNTGWSTADISKAYDSKNIIEDDFACFKGRLFVRIMPIEVRKDNRVRVHVELCVWGMLFYRYLARKLKTMGIDVTFGRMIEELKDIRLAVVENKESNKIEIKLEEMNPLQARIFTALNLARYIPESKR